MIVGVMTFLYMIHQELLEVEKRGGARGNNEKGWEIKRKGRGRRMGGG